MKVKTLLINSVSFAVISSAVAAQEVDNVALIDQDGNDNKATIMQEGSLNAVGFRDADNSENDIYAIQSGDLNTLWVTQNGNSNVVSAAGTGFVQTGDRSTTTITQNQNNNVVQAISQTGTSGSAASQNELTITQGSTSNLTPNESANVVSSIQQANTLSGAANSITITQTRSDGGSVSGIASANRIGREGEVITQEGSNNSLELTQTGLANLIADVTQSGGTGNTATIIQDNSGSTGTVVGNEAGSLQNGSDNTLTITMAGDGNGTGGLTARFASGVGAADSAIQQIGSTNTAEWNATGDNNQFGIVQNGSRNTSGVSSLNGNNNQTAFVQNGDDNDISIVDINNDNIDLGVSQSGNNNDILVGTLSGLQNALQLIQIGDANSMDFDVSGAMNSLRAQQGTAGVVQTGNEMIVDIAGSSNSTDYDGDITNDDNGLFQAGFDNTLTLVVTGSSNLFKTSQSGNGNAADITLTGASNTLALSQMAAEGAVLASNLYEITIAGSDNDVIGIQTGSANELVAKINGSNNIFNTTQIGSTNLMDLDVKDSNGTYNLTQNGTGNVLTGKLRGTGNTTHNMTVEQIGDYNVAQVNQKGAKNKAHIKQ